MNRFNAIACVTGATGMIGRTIISVLVKNGYKVRAYSRKSFASDVNVEFLCGGLEDEARLYSFLKGANLLFHCAAELKDETKMWDVNVLGTERLIRIAENSGIEYFCHISSAGVVGSTNQAWVDENTPCNPQNAYESSKLAAEQIVARGIRGCRIVILRPTNVVHESRPGALSLPIQGSFSDRLKVFLKGGECAHVIHAEDVAAAALYFINKPIVEPQCFFVSCDHEPLNTFAGLWALYTAYSKGLISKTIKLVPHLPLLIPYYLRKLWRGKGNRGDIRYSSEKLLSYGFKFPLGLEGAVKKVALKSGE